MKSLKIESVITSLRTSVSLLAVTKRLLLFRSIQALTYLSYPIFLKLNRVSDVKTLLSNRGSL